MPANLESLGYAYRTDKQRHGYLPVYERYLGSFRDEAITLIEIGVGEGASLRMWEEYFPNARIVGIDCVEACAQFATERVRVEIGHQEDLTFIQEVLGRHGAPDVVIDDGSHRSSDIIATFERMFPQLSPGGVYIIEDLHTSYDPQLCDREVSAASYLANLVHDVNRHGHGQSGSYQESIKKHPAPSPFEHLIDSLHFHQSLCVVARRRGRITVRRS